MEHAQTPQANRPSRERDSRPKSRTVRAVAPQDNRAEAIQLRALIGATESSPGVLAKQAQITGMFGDSRQLMSPRQQGPSASKLIQRQVPGIESSDTGSADRSRPSPAGSRTGLPDKLKSGIESLSGLAMDDVRVHLNSAQPSQLNALAYAQGNDIHIGPGQEKHLPHEAWHVVQQAQGRVKPTMQMKGGVQINDDPSLEHDADLMGAKALTSPFQLQSTPRDAALRGASLSNSRHPIQAKDDPATFKKAIAAHMDEIKSEKGETTPEALYALYEEFTAHTDVTTEQFAILLKAKNVNPGGQHQGPQSRSVKNLQEKVFSVFEQNNDQIQILRTSLEDTPLGVSVNFENLLKKMGEGDIQGPKLRTLVQEIVLGNDLFDLALRIGKRISANALKSFRETYGKSIMEAESKVLKKLNRELNAALAVLTHDDLSVTLVMSSLSYKVPVLSENAEFDLLFGVNGSEEQVIVEVQSIPDTIGGKAVYEDNPDLDSWDPATVARLIEYLVTTMYQKRERLSLLQEKQGVLKDIPIVLMTTRKLPAKLYDALTKSGMFLPVMQEHMKLSDVISSAVTTLKLGTEKSTGKTRRLAAAQEKEATTQLRSASPEAGLTDRTAAETEPKWARRRSLSPAVIHSSARPHQLKPDLESIPRTQIDDVPAGFAFPWSHGQTDQSTEPQQMPLTKHPPVNPQDHASLAQVAQLKNGKKSKHDRKDRRLAKQTGFHLSELDEGVTAAQIVRAHEERYADEPPAPEDMGTHTDHLAKRVLPTGTKVALIGENHAETSQLWEGSYFRARNLGYHHEVSSLQQTYVQRPSGALEVAHQLDNFAIENVPLRALSEVLDLVEYQKDFAATYIVPISNFWADCTKITEKMDTLVNAKLLGKLAKKLHLTKHDFATQTMPRISSSNSLYLSALNNLFGEMEATANSLQGTRWAAEATKLGDALKQAEENYEPHSLSLSFVMELEESEHFEFLLKDIEALEKYQKTMENLLPALQSFLYKVIASQSPGAVQLGGTGTETEDQVSKGRSEAMVNNAVWLSENTSKTGEIVKVGESHINDINAVDVDAPKLNIIHMSDYYEMQDETNTSSLRIKQ